MLRLIKRRIWQLRKARWEWHRLRMEQKIQAWCDGPFCGQYAGSEQYHLDMARERSLESKIKWADEKIAKYTPETACPSPSKIV